MKKIEKVILKLENDLAKHEDTINELVVKISNFKIFDSVSNTIEKKHCTFFLFIILDFVFIFFILIFKPLKHLDYFR